MKVSRILRMHIQTFPIQDILRVSKITRKQATPVKVPENSQSGRALKLLDDGKSFTGFAREDKRNSIKVRAVFVSLLLVKTISP